MNGFLDDLPDISLENERPKPRKRRPGGDDERVVCVIYTIARCPYCDSHQVPTYDSKGALKYRRCSDCGKTFKSVVRNYEPHRD